VADPILEIDAAGSNIDGTNPGAALTITTGNYGLLSLISPAPPAKVQWASSVDTEGSLAAAVGHENRTITISLDVTGQTALTNLTQKIGKLHREGGTLKHTGSAGTVVIADIPATADFEPAYDHLRLLGGVTTVTFTLPARPYLRGPEVELGTDTVETTLPYLVKTVTGPAGDWYALGRLVIDNDQAVDQWSMLWGIQSRYYDAGASAALFYEAESRTALGGSATAAGPSGASGAGSNVMRNTDITTSYQAILSTQASGGGAHLSHIGSFRVYARMQAPTTNTGTVTVALSWAEGEFRKYTTNPSVDLAYEGVWLLADLGLVTLSKVTKGTQQWEGRIIAKSTGVKAGGTTSDDLDIDYLLLIPVDEGSGVVSGVDQLPTNLSFVAWDDFTGTTAGNVLNARVAPLGGTWATSGAATDIVFADAAGVFSGEHVTRSASGIRYAILGATNYTNVAVGLTFDPDEAGEVVARWTDASNHLIGLCRPISGPGSLLYSRLEISKMIAGAETLLRQSATFVRSPTTASIRLVVSASGRAVLWLLDANDNVVGRIGVYDATLATAGTLATGKPGFADGGTGARHDDDFWVAVPSPDSAISASQSIEVRSDGVIREDPGGTIWSDVSSYVGDYLAIPPTAQEGRTARVIVKTVRDDPSVSDGAIDDLSARLFATPRFLTIPD
jgi:hypothetical protein